LLSLLRCALLLPLLFPCLLLQALEQLRPFQPDVIIAVGGGSPMDAAKLMWLMYEQPGTKFEEVAARFMVRPLLRGAALLLVGASLPFQRHVQCVY
jgi:alcohol dehydrogenase YqhD (iron-dependent ADH family)